MPGEGITIKTATLMHRLFKAPDIADFLSANGEVLQTPDFCAYIAKLCEEKGLVRERVIKQSQIERTYGHQLFNGRRVPSRDKVIQLAFGFGLNVEETQQLLKIAQKSALYPKIRRDAVILFCISHGLDVLDAQTLLESQRLTLLGGEDRRD